MEKNLQWIRRTVKIKKTFYISVPAPWAAANGIKRYGEVTVKMEKDGSLRITAVEDKK